MENYIKKYFDKFWDWILDNDLDYTFMFVFGCIVTASIFTIVYFWYN